MSQPKFQVKISIADSVLTGSHESEDIAIAFQKALNSLGNQALVRLKKAGNTIRNEEKAITFFSKAVVEIEKYPEGEDDGAS